MTPITAALRELAAKATPGPWQAYIAYSGESGTPDEVGIYAGAGTTHHGQENTVISDWTLYGSEMLPDLEYIAALSPSTLNRLLDVVEAAEAMFRVVNVEDDMAATKDLSAALAALEADHAV